MKHEKSCGCIIVNNDEVLLIISKNDEGKMFWTFPKGHQESGENDLETALRETKEEVGLDVEITDKTPIKVSYLIHDGTVQKDVYLFMAKTINKNIRLQEEELEAAKWVKIDDVRDKYLKNGYNNYLDVWDEVLSKILSKKEKN